MESREFLQSGFIQKHSFAEALFFVTSVGEMTVKVSRLTTISSISACSLRFFSPDCTAIQIDISGGGRIQINTVKCYSS